MRTVNENSGLYFSQILIRSNWCISLAYKIIHKSKRMFLFWICYSFFFVMQKNLRSWSCIQQSFFFKLLIILLTTRNIWSNKLALILQMHNFSFSFTAFLDSSNCEFFTLLRFRANIAFIFSTTLIMVNQSYLFQ